MKKTAGRTAAPVAAPRKAATRAAPKAPREAGAKTGAKAAAKPRAKPDVKPAMKPRGEPAARSPRPASTDLGVPPVTAADVAPREMADASPAPQRSAKHLLTAGIKALTTVHEEAVARQSRVFESLLGVRRDDPSASEPRPAAVPGTALDPFGFRKFEDVFDQRVASALQHLELPTAAAFAELKAEVERLRETVAVLEAQTRRR